MDEQGELLTVWRLGHKFQASRRTIQHLDWTIARLKRRFPWATLIIIQTCYHTGVNASAHTHDKDCVFDFRISGLTWRRAQIFLRNAGWGAWWRHTGEWADPHAWHLHAISLPPGLVRGKDALQVGEAFHKLGIVVGEYIDGGYTTTGKIVATSQVVDYLAVPSLDGLADHGPDPTWHPKNINATLYAYRYGRAA
jgi:hypothetical protein